MALRLLSFAQCADWMGRPKKESRISRPVRLTELFNQPDLSGLRGYSRGSRFAVNQEFAGLDTWIRDGDEVAVLPPISGG